MSMKLIRIQEVMERTALRKSTIYKYMNLGKFPQQIKLSARAVAWVESEVEAWIRDHMAQRDEESA